MTPEPVAGRDAKRTDRSWMITTSIALAVIWIAVLVISVFAPDLVSGSEQERIPLAAFTTWVYGSIGTAALLWAMAKLRGDPQRKPMWIGYGAVVSIVWVGAAVLSLTLPELETGTDPTKVPLAALFAPLAAAMLTALAGIVVTVFGSSPDHA